MIAPTFNVSDESYGLTQQKTTHESVEVGEARGGNGKVMYQQAYSKTVDVEKQVILAGSLPIAGSVDQTDGLVLDVSKTEAMGKYVEATVKHQKKDSAAQTAYS